MMTHNELVKLAFLWLKNKKSCSVVASEMTSGAGETADVIGWQAYRGSILVEAKISISDFRADLKKSFRSVNNQEIGMGRKRYYIMPGELAEKVISEIPAGWGLLICEKSRIYVVQESQTFDCNESNEIILLISIIRRIGTENPMSGISVKRYVEALGSVNPRSELFIEEAGD